MWHRVGLSAVWLIMQMSIASAQYFQCPAGSVNVGGGGGIMCMCPDGSYASIYGCPQHARPQPSGIPCGNGYCPFGTSCSRSGNSCLQPGSVDCGSHACAAGEKCSRGGGCVAANAQQCGNGYCSPGLICTRAQQCIDASQSNGNMLSIFLAVEGLTSVPQLEKMLPGEKLSTEVKKGSDVPEPWYVITARKQMLGTDAVSISAPVGTELNLNGYNPFTRKFDISVTQLNSKGFPDFAPPTDPSTWVAPDGCSMNPVTHEFACVSTFSQH